jgi:hypothetical protein
VAGQAGDDPEHGHDEEENPAGDAGHTTKTPLLTTTGTASGHPLSELADTHHPHRPGAPSCLQAAATVETHGGEPARRGAARPLLPPTIALGRHRQK